MRKAVLVFENVDALSDYVLQFHPGPLEVNTPERSLSGFFSDNELTIACTQYGAAIQSMEPLLIESSDKL